MKSCSLRSACRLTFTSRRHRLRHCQHFVVKKSSTGECETKESTHCRRNQTQRLWASSRRRRYGCAHRSARRPWRKRRADVMRGLDGGSRGGGGQLRDGDRIQAGHWLKHFFALNAETNLEDVRRSKCLRNNNPNAASTNSVLMPQLNTYGRRRYSSPSVDASA